MKRVLVISPHPDDEAIGLGGTLRRHVVQGDHVRIIFLTSGEAGIRGQEAAETARIRELEAAAAAAVLGYSVLEFWREPDGALQVTPTLLQRLRDELESWKPELIYVPHAAEMHPDHKAALALVERAIDPLGSRPQVRMYEVWTPIQLIDHVEDISEHIELKIEAIRAHRSQCAIMRFDESARGLARYRGEMHSWPGGPYAEVFQCSFPRSGAGSA